MKTWTDARGVKREYTDEQVVEQYLEGRVDYYSGGELEHLRDAITNLRQGVAHLLVKISGKSVVDYCEKELG